MNTVENQQNKETKAYIPKTEEEKEQVRIKEFFGYVRAFCAEVLP